MPLDPAATTTTTTTTAAASRPISPLPHPHHHYPSPQQQQTLPIRPPNPQLPKPHDPSHHYLYPFASSARGAGFGTKGFAAPPADHAVPGYPPPPPPPASLVYAHGVRGMHLDYLSHALHVTRPLPHLPYPQAGHAPPTASPPVKGHTKASARSAVSDVNGHKDTSTRERSKDETFIVVRDRKVRLTENASLYALCRSWLRNGIIEESQPQQKEVMKALPKPLPASMVATSMSNKKEDEKDDEQEESEEPVKPSSAEDVKKIHMKNMESVKHLSAKDLLKRHIKRAKRVRAHLREERLQRITRYRSRLRLLLPPPVEQFRNDTAAGY